jgi:hypothetical protein
MSVLMHDKLCQNYTCVGETLVEHPNYHYVRQGTPNVAILQWVHSIAIQLFSDFSTRRNCDISYNL